MRWYTLPTPSIEVPKHFYVALAFNPHQTKGIYLGLDGSVKASHSYTGLPDTGFEKWRQKQDWMVRVHLTEKASGGKTVQKLADWKPRRAGDPFAGCFEVRLDIGKSDGKQSYGGRGPAVRINVADYLPDSIPLGKAELVGIRVYASRYGSGYDPENTPVTVSLLDGGGKVIRQQNFAYSLFSYKEKWVSLPLDTPLLLKDLPSGQASLTVAFDPQAHRTKGIYFHYNKDPKTSHSLVGTVAGGFKAISDRQWMIRLYLRSRQ